MSLQDYLMPEEEVRFNSKGAVKSGKKPYQFILTNERIILYAKRLPTFSLELSNLRDVKYEESGLIGKKGHMQLQTEKTRHDLNGPAAKIKALYQQVKQFL